MRFSYKRIESEQYSLVFFLFDMRNLLIGILLGTCIILGWLLWKPREVQHEIPIPVVDNSKELGKIDSLERCIREKDTLILDLKKKINTTRETIVVKVKEVQELTTSEGTEKLRENLIRHGEHPVDSLPMMCKTDSNVIVSPGNLKDINSVFVKYEGEVEINSTLSEIIKTDSIQKESLTGIIVQKDSILVRNDNLTKALEVSLRKEKKKKNLWKWLGISIGVVLGAVAITK